MKKKIKKSNRSVSLQVRVTPKTYKELTRIVSKEELTLSELLRDLIRDYLKSA